MIDIEALNELIKVWIGVGIFFIIIICLLGVIVAIYYFSKINQIDEDNFKKRVKAVLKDGSTNSKK